jgi:hypothetical protein
MNVLESVEIILKDILMMNDELLEPPSELKRLYYTTDGDILDLDQLSTKFVEDIIELRNDKISEWVLNNTHSCKFVMEIYHPEKIDKFIELSSMCNFRTSRSGSGDDSDLFTTQITYLDSIKIFDSNINNKNNTYFRINLVQPFLFYLKKNGLISEIKFFIEKK